MQKFPVVFDLETKHTFREFKEHRDLGITVLATYDYATGQPKVFTENELSSLFPLFEHASYLIGYNIKSFDLPVLAPYYPGNIEHFVVFDILDDIKNKIGFRLALNDVASATLGKKKSGHGLMAIDYYKEGKWDKLKKYCLDDVLVTKELLEFGARTGEIYYLSEKGRETIHVDWKKYLEPQRGNDMPLTLPF